MPGAPFDLPLPSGSPLGRAAVTVARPVLSRALGLTALTRVYRATQRETHRHFADAALDALGIRVDCPSEDLRHIPATGPAILVANHPRGLADGLVVASLAQRVRPDVRLVANHLLAQVPELAELCFFVDPFGGPAAAARSRAGLRAAHLWLRHEGAIVLFPSGEVAPARRGHAAVDAPWHATALRLAQQTGATVVPVHLEGTNSRCFYGAGRLHPRLRTALLGRELLRQRGETVRVRLGAGLRRRAGAGAVAAESAEALTQRARAAVDDLASAGPSAPTSADALTAEIASLPASARLLAHGPFDVFVTDAARVPSVLAEIGRLRELTYAAAGEGSGRPIDLDAFDTRYLHLFTWDRNARCVVGAYRLGLTDVIAARHGVTGLYTRTLFRYDEAFLDRLGPAIELGRSFVRAEYQRQHSALLLLWKGIGAFLAGHPQYRVLFGPVSISRSYSDLSRALLRTYLEQRHLDDELAALVAACHPLADAGSPVAFAFPETIDEVQKRIRALEPDGKGVPVLVRQYLQLDARVVGFNLDPAFSNVVDALMIVDLADVRPALLQRVLGQAAATHVRAARTPRGVAA